MSNGNTHSTTPQPAAGGNGTGGITIDQLYSVIGAKEVVICQLNAGIMQLQQQMQEMETRLAAVQRECESLRTAANPAGTPG